MSDVGIPVSLLPLACGLRRLVAAFCGRSVSLVPDDEDACGGFDDVFGDCVTAFTRRSVIQDRAPTCMSGNEGSRYTKTAKTSPHPRSVTQRVSAPMSRSRGFALRSGGEHRLRVDPGSEPRRPAQRPDRGRLRSDFRRQSLRQVGPSARAGDHLDLLGRSLEHLIALSKDLQEHKVAARLQGL